MQADFEILELETLCMFKIHDNPKLVIELEEMINLVTSESNDDNDLNYNFEVHSYVKNIYREDEVDDSYNTLSKNIIKNAPKTFCNFIVVPPAIGE